MNNLYEISGLRCSYDRHFVEGKSRVALEIRKLEIPRGKKVFIVGESGIGKSTILETLGLMNNTIVAGPQTKFIFYAPDGNPVDLAAIWSGGDRALSEFRVKHFSFIFQSTNLMRNFSAYENVAMTRMIQGYDRESSFKKTDTLLRELGLEHIDPSRMTQELSGGQQQRLAFARAILPDFTVLFGDEPTGNLDSDNAVKAMRLLSNKLSTLEGSSAIIVSHDMPLAISFADVIIKIRRELRKSTSVADEMVSYGVIDERSVFTAVDGRSVWTNGSESYIVGEFERFLKRG